LSPLQTLSKIAAGFTYFIASQLPQSWANSKNRAQQER
jgi:hypothetical protein